MSVALASGPRASWRPACENATRRTRADSLFDAGVPTAIGVGQESGHPEPRIIAREGPPNRAAVKDYGARWAIEPLFSDFKSRGFRLEDTQLEAPKRLDGLILIRALAMYWCVRAGQEDARSHPTATEKKRVNKPIPTIGASARPTEAPSPGSNAVSASC